jgi:hypothetical protein
MDIKQLYIENCEGYDEYLPDGSCKNGLRMTIDGFKNALTKVSQIEPLVMPNERELTEYYNSEESQEWLNASLGKQQASGAVAEILVEHSADGIKDYNRDAFSKLKQQLLEKLKLLYNIKFDVKSKDTITVSLEEEPYFYKIKDRTIDITDKLYVTYWVADL